MLLKLAVRPRFDGAFVFCLFRRLCFIGLARHPERTGIAFDTASSSSPMPNPCSELIGYTSRRPSCRKFSASASIADAFNFVHSQEDRLVSALQQADEIVIGARELSTRVHDKDQRISVFEGHLSLVEDFGRNEFRIVGHDAARIDQPEAPPSPFVLPVDAVARDAWLVANDGAPAPRNRLNSVDLPTFGRPTMATSGNAAAPGFKGTTDLRYVGKVLYAPASILWVRLPGIASI